MLGHVSKYGFNQITDKNSSSSEEKANLNQEEKHKMSIKLWKHKKDKVRHMSSESKKKTLIIIEFFTL